MAFAGPSAPQVYVTTCDGYEFEEWKIAYTEPSTGYIELQNELYPGDCLNDHYNDGSGQELNAATCNEGTDELWFGEHAIQ